MKKGFTLIELLAVIVILAIIALIATPIVLNIIAKARENSHLRSGEMYLDAVKMAVANSSLEDNIIQDGTYNILEDGDLCLEYSGTTCSKRLEVEVDGETPKEGTITISNEQISEISFKYNKKTIIKNEKGKLVYQDGSTSNPVCTYADVDNSESINLSDVVTCGTESFYVMKNDGTNITMLSKYNLNVGDSPYTEGTVGIQNENAVGYSYEYNEYGGVDIIRGYGNVQFSTTDYWLNNNTLLSQYGTSYPVDVYDTNSNLYNYVNDYETYLKETIKVSSASAALMTVKQATDLGCNVPTSIPSYGSYVSCSAPGWVISTSYYMGFAVNEGIVSMDYTGAQNLTGTGLHTGFNSNYFMGVRPVVTISISEVK